MRPNLCSSSCRHSAMLFLRLRDSEISCWQTIILWHNTAPWRPTAVLPVPHPFVDEFYATALSDIINLRFERWRKHMRKYWSLWFSRSCLDLLLNIFVNITTQDSQGIYTPLAWGVSSFCYNVTFLSKQVGLFVYIRYRRCVKLHVAFEA